MSDDTNTIEVPTDIAPDAITSPLAFALARFDDGDLLRTASADLEAVIAHVLTTGVKSSLSINITVLAADRAESGTPQCVLRMNAIPKMPKEKPPEHRMYVFSSGNHHQLMPYDPQQPPLFGSASDSAQNTTTAEPQTAPVTGRTRKPRN